MRCSRRIASPESGLDSIVVYATGTGGNVIPALKRLAKFMPTLASKTLQSEVPKVGLEFELAVEINRVRFREPTKPGG